MDVKDIFAKMRNYINSNFSVYLVSRVYKEKFNESLNMMECHIDILDKEDKIEVFDLSSTTPVVEECVDYLMGILPTIKLDGMFRQFISDYVFVVYNWNNNVWKNNNFNSKLQYLQRFVNDGLSLNEITNVLNKLSRDLGRYKEWIPPSFELSRHYYNLLKEE